MAVLTGAESEGPRGLPRGLGVQRERAHLFHWLVQKSREVSVFSRSL